MASNNESHFWDSFMAFTVGAVTGFVLGILFAPASGKETRAKIKEEAIKATKSAKESYGKIAQEAEKGIRVVKEKATEGIDTIREFIDKKKEELTKKEV